MIDAEAFQDLEDALNVVRDAEAYDNAESTTKSRAFELLKSKLKHANQQESTKESMCSFWLSYLEMVGLLLQFIRAARTRNWELHLACIKKILPWFFAYDHMNYAGYLTLYWTDMVQLPQSNYAAHKALQEGDFVVARSTKPFAKIPVDQTIEQTFNRESKTPGGITGFSHNPGAVERWVLTAHESTKAARACLNLAGLSQDASHTRH